LGDVGLRVEVWIFLLGNAKCRTTYINLIALKLLIQVLPSEGKVHAK
jgi:hypothetical protein